MQNRIQAGSAREVHVFRRLAQAQHAFAAALGGDEVDVRQFGDRMPHGFVQPAPRNLAAVNVGYDLVHSGAGHRSGKRFRAVAEHQHNLGVQAFERLRHPVNPDADRLGHGRRGVAAEGHIHAGIGEETVFFDFAIGVAELVRQMHSGHDQA